MAMAVGGAKGPKSEINITPYIDILLVLLIIFMVVTPTKKHDLDVRVPQPPPDTKQDIQPNPDTIVVTINADNSVLINSEPVDINSLQDRLQKIYSARANKNLFIRGYGQLPYGQVVNIIDKAKGAGVGDIGLITLESKG